MLRAYKSIEHDFKKAHELIEYLVYEVWCKADATPVITKLNDTLKKLYEDGRLKTFKANVDEIYTICQGLDEDEKTAFATIFQHNNRIPELCAGGIKPMALSTLNKELREKVKSFFEGLYTGFLGWKTVCDTYSDKKSYYNALITQNDFNECPCCGYGDIKNEYSKGYSAYDHYLPQKHYPLSTTNANNLVPTCTECNSDEKGEDDILESGQPVFYPFDPAHPNIEESITVTVASKALDKFTEKDRTKRDFESSEIAVDFTLADDRIASWNTTYGIKTRYFGKVAINGKSWLDQVRALYRLYADEIPGYNMERAFEGVLKVDSDKQLRFLKRPFLGHLKSDHAPLLRAIIEVSGDSRINT